MNRRSWAGNALGAWAAARLGRSLGAEEKSAEKETAAIATAPTAKPKWAPSHYQEVGVYRFGDLSIESLIQNGQVQSIEFGQKKIKGAALSKDHTERLLTAVVGGPEIRDPFACYNPHDIFLFLDGSHVIKGAFEVCFSCRGFRCLPGPASHTGPDFRALAKLCEETVGLVNGQTAEEYIRKLDEEEEKAKGKAAESGKKSAS